MRPARAVARRSSILLALLAACEPGPAGPRLVWSSRPASSFVCPRDAAPSLSDSALRRAPEPRDGIGNIVREGGGFWLPEAPDGARAEFRVLHLDPGRHEAKPPANPFAGREPRIAALAGGQLLLVSLESSGAGAPRLVARRGSAGGGTWGEAVTVSDRSGTPSLGSSRPIVVESGLVLLAVVWRDPAAGAEVVCHASRDGGASWSEAGVLRADGVRDACLAPLDAGGVLLVLDRDGELAASVSTDSARSWGAPRALGVRALPLGFAVERREQGGELALAWTDPAPDTTAALPGLQALSVAVSEDAGSTWRRLQPLALWPGRVPVAPTVWFDAGSFVAAFVDAAPPGAPVAGADRVVCLASSRAALEAAPGVASSRARYGIDPAAAGDALRILCAHTLARPRRASRLFVESYFMRSEVAAHAVFARQPSQNPEWFDAGAPLRCALEWGDRLVATQDSIGYWPTGYGAVYVADIGAALGLFPALEPYADATRLAAYERAARRFTAALVEDGMILPSGACGVGWWHTTIPRNPQRVMRQPFLVSTALAGIELQAWLYRRGGRPEDRERALRALDWTLAQIQPDGSFAPGPRVPGTGFESSLVSAAYVHEGWMAADILLQDPKVLERLRAALGPHVDWLLRQQRPDGRWDSGAAGEFARTTAIAGFLLWYDQRCQSRPDVREAVRRAGLLLVDPAGWESGLYRAGDHQEVQRALAGRVLAALAGQRFVL